MPPPIWRFILRGILGWFIRLILTGLCLMWGFDPETLISAFFSHPPSWVFNIWTRIGAVILGGFLGWWSYRSFLVWRDEKPLRYLEHPTTGLSTALLAAAMKTSWGKRCRKDSQGTEQQKIINAMGVALYPVQSATRKGELEIRGQIPDTTEYEVISPDTLAHATLIVDVVPRQDVANPFRVRITAGSPPNPELERMLERELSYSHLDVNSRQFEAVIDSLNPRGIKWLRANIYRLKKLVKRRS